MVLQMCGSDSMQNLSGPMPGVCAAQWAQRQPSDEQLAALQQTMGYRFRDVQLLRQAFHTPGARESLQWPQNSLSVIHQSAQLIGASGHVCIGAMCLYVKWPPPQCWTIILACWCRQRMPHAFGGMCEHDLPSEGGFSMLL